MARGILEHLYRLARTLGPEADVNMLLSQLISEFLEGGGGPEGPEGYGVAATGSNNTPLINSGGRVYYPANSRRIIDRGDESFTRFSDADPLPDDYGVPVAESDRILLYEGEEGRPGATTFLD